MTKKSCRRTMDENKIHEKAVKMRKKTDEQLVHYVDDLQKQVNTLENEVHRMKRVEARRKWRYGRKKY